MPIITCTGLVLYGGLAHCRSAFRFTGLTAEKTVDLYVPSGEVIRDQQNQDFCAGASIYTLPQIFRWHDHASRLSQYRYERGF